MPEPQTEWFVAEGQASDFFSMFLLLANPNPSPTQVTVRYLMPGRTPTTKCRRWPANSRYTIEIGNQNDAPGVVNTDVSVEVKATLPIIVERAMYWPKNGGAGPTATPARASRRPARSGRSPKANSAARAASRATC